MRDHLINQALSRITGGDGRKEAAFWLAQQVRDNAPAKEWFDGECRSILHEFSRSLPQPSGKRVLDERYMDQLWTSVNSRPARDPWPDKEEFRKDAAKPARRNGKQARVKKIDPATIKPPVRTGDVHEMEASKMLLMSDQERAAYSEDAHRDAERISQESREPEFYLEFAPALPDVNLSPFFNELLSTYEHKHERDVFALGALGVLSGCLPNVWFKTATKYYAPNLYVCITAPPGTGKGTLDHARQVGGRIAQEMIERNEIALMRYKDECADAKTNGTDPPERPRTLRHYIAADSSATPFLTALMENDGRGTMFTTEIYPFLNATKSDWGDYRDVMLQAAEHETAQKSRSDRDIVVTRPCLSVVMTGTPGQFLELIPSTEDGLFSRFNFFYFQGTDRWISQRPTATTDRRLELLEDAGERAFRMFRQLEGRTKPLYINFTDQAWDVVDEHYNQTKHLAAGHHRDLIPSVHRGGINAMRIAAVVACLRHYEKVRDLTETYTAIQVDASLMRHAVDVQRTMLDHAFRLARYLRRSAVLKDFQPSLRTAVLRLYDRLPNLFSRADLMEAAAAMGVQKTAAYKYRKLLLQMGLVVPSDKGYGWCSKNRGKAETAESAESAETSAETVRGVSQL